MSRLSPFLLAALLFAGVSCRAGVEDLRCEYLTNPLGLDAARPRLSWIITSKQRGEKQIAYEIIVASSRQGLDHDEGDLWDSGKVESDETAEIAYEGQALESRERCYWKVRVWDEKASPGGWSQPAMWEMGLLKPEDWRAKWISRGSELRAPAQRLVIRRAVYGADDGKSADVTKAVARHVRDNVLSLVANNHALGGDPAKNEHKHLHVEYELGGRPGVREVNEGETLSIPGEALSVPSFRKTFVIEGPVRRAMLYVTALGLYEARLNGRRVGDHVLAPDWTDYRKRVRYQAYDVTSLVHPGENALAALLGNGWYSGHIGNGGFEFFGRTPALLAQLEVTDKEGRVQTIVTDDSWKWHPSPILSSDFMLGETYDARREVKGWDAPGLDESGWGSVKVRQEPDIAIQAQVSPPVREICELKPKSMAEPERGHWVYDLGQNMVGVARLKTKAPAGTEITLRHAEMLNPDGTIYTKNLRGAASVDHYICKGGGTETWQPRFTFHGFRYVELTGVAGKPRLDAVTGIVIASDTPRTGEFSCSDPLLNQLQSNIQWGQRGNYLSVPTDCPQRDERLGWMGDAEVFVRTATYNADVASFFTKWLVDVDDGQTAAGSFSDVSPKTSDGNGVPAWGDAGVICPWTIYLVYGDKRILERHLPAMTKWVEYLRRDCVDLIRTKDRGGDYGDWLSIHADTPKDLIGTAFFAYSTHLLAKSYAAVGQADEAAKYENLFEDIKAAFIKRYVSEDGHVHGDTQCAYAMALKFDLLPESLRPVVAQRLVDDIRAKGNHLSTGFVGVSYLLPVLTTAGHVDTAYRLLLQDTFPSWLFSVKQGATTIWERWDGWTPEKGFQDPGMNSFNHYSLGSCGEYLFGGVGGIQPASPGYKTILINPAIGPGLTWARTSYDSMHGRIATFWRRDGGRFELDVTIPANTTATIAVPAEDAASVTESGHALENGRHVALIRAETGRVLVAVGSGTYKFRSTIGS